jgi:hypothetical protein
VLKVILATASLAIFAPALAFAQSAKSGSESGSQAVANVGTLEEGGSAGGYYGAHGNNVDAVAPTIYSNNSCALSVAGSASFLGIGFGAGFNSVDKHCDDRATEIIMLTASQRMGSPVLAQWAVNLMCKDNAGTAPAGVCGTGVVAISGVVSKPVHQASYTSPQPVVTATPGRPVNARGEPCLDAACSEY